MGNCCPILSGSKKSYLKEFRILMLGLDGAGKTTILYRLKQDEVVETSPTTGHNSETIEYSKNKFNIWDIGGKKSGRWLWRHHFVGNDVVIFVVDASRKDRFEEAQSELKKLLFERELKGIPFLVFANKEDLQEAEHSVQKLQDILAISDNENQRRIFVQPSCALTGAGLYEGLDWILSRK